MFKVGDLISKAGPSIKMLKLGVILLLALFLTIIPILAFLFYYLCIIIVNFTHVSVENFVLYIIYLVLFYVVFRNMRVGKIAIISFYILSTIIFFFRPSLSNIWIISYVSSFFEKLYYYMGLFTLNDNFIKTTINMFGFNEILVISVVGVISYFYLFQYIKKRGISIYEVEKSEGKFGEITVSAKDLYDKINLVIFFLMISYLFLNLGSVNTMMELVILFSLFVVNYKIFSSVIDNYKTLVHSYGGISSINNGIDYGAITNFYNNRYNLKFTDYAKFVANLYSNLPLFIFDKRLSTIIINNIIVVSFTLLFIGYIFNFNFLSILYIELTLVIWYSYLCIIDNIPESKVDITLTNELNGIRVLPEHYIIDDFSKEYLVVIDKNNQISKIMKSSILKIDLHREPMQIQNSPPYD